MPLCSVEFQTIVDDLSNQSTGEKQQQRSLLHKAGHSSRKRDRRHWVYLTSLNLASPSVDRFRAADSGKPLSIEGPHWAKRLELEGYPTNRFISIPSVCPLGVTLPWVILYALSLSSLHFLPIAHRAPVYAFVAILRAYTAGLWKRTLGLEKNVCVANKVCLCPCKMTFAFSFDTCYNIHIPFLAGNEFAKVCVVSRCWHVRCLQKPTRKLEMPGS